jgi:two-component system cell cycle sensor histidine kinase/response regulator CckA
MSEQQRYALLSESLPVGIIFQEPTGAILEANPTALRILDVAREDCIGTSLSSLMENAVDEDGKVIPQGSFPQCLALKTKREIPPRVIGLVSRRCPEPVWIRARSFPLIDSTGAVLEICTTLEDVNDAKRLRELLHQSQKREAVQTLAGGVAHDFNNMLTVVAGHAELLESRLQNDPEALLELREIISATKSASDLTRQLLTLGRKQRDYANGRFTPERVVRIA